MRDLYEPGLRSLQARLPTEALDEFGVYEARLRENLRRDQLFGGTESTRAERAFVVDGLNQLARRHLGISFNDLCQAEVVPAFSARGAQQAVQSAAPEPTRVQGPAEQAAPPQLPVQVTMEFQTAGAPVTLAWHAPIVGEVVTPFTPPYDDATLPMVIKALDAAQYPDRTVDDPAFSADERAALAQLGLWQAGWVATNIHKTVGLALYNALGPEGMSVLKAVRNYGIDQRRPTSYMLRFPRNAVQLAALPWELIADQDQPILLSRGTDIDSCERYITLDRAIPPVRAGLHKPHLLALLPTYALSEQVRQEERAARLKSWERLRAAGQITFDEISPLTRLALSEHLRNAERKPDIIHFFGHGTYRDGQGYLLFDNDTGGTSLVSATQLAALLGDIRLVVLHACQSARVGAADGLLTGVAPALSLVTGAVVAMQLTVRVPAATRFAEVFYDELLRRRRSLQAAVATARQTLFFEEEDGASWFVPTLYIRSREQQPVFIMEG